MTEGYLPVEVRARRDILRFIRSRIIPMLRRDDATRLLFRSLRSKPLRWVVELDTETTRHHTDNRESYWVQGVNPANGDVLEFVVQKVINEGEYLSSDNTQAERFGHMIPFEAVVLNHAILGAVVLNLCPEDANDPTVIMWGITNILHPTEDE